MLGFLFGPSKYLGYEKAMDVEFHDRYLSDAGGSDASTIVPVSVSKSKIDARMISDAIIGLSDGMTVPFALTAGLSAIGDTRVVIFGGFAELIAGAISMGLGGYLGAKSEEDSYHETYRKTVHEAKVFPDSTADTISSIFSSYNVPQNLIEELTDHISASPNLPDFLMRFEHGVSEPTASRAMTCAITIALGYFIGGFIPLLPYLFVARANITHALTASVAIMVVALFAFGYSKTCFVCGWRRRSDKIKGVKGGCQMVVVGGLAAGSAMLLVKTFNSLM